MLLCKKVSRSRYSLLEQEIANHNRSKGDGEIISEPSPPSDGSTLGAPICALIPDVDITTRSCIGSGASPHVILGWPLMTEHMVRGVACLCSRL